MIGLGASFLAAWICWESLGRIPHISDEVSYSFQGRIFASGKLWLEPPEAPEAFAVDHILISQNRWSSIYTPGWPLLLALGWLVHAPWIVNPLLLIGCILGLWKLGSILYDGRTAMLGTILCGTSPFVLLMGSGYMSHIAAMSASIWCLVFLLRAKNHRSLLTAGALAGFAFLARPYTAVALLSPAMLWVLWNKKKEAIAVAGMLVMGLLPSLAFWLIYNQVLFGGPFKTGYDSDPTWNVIHFGASYFLQNIGWYWNALNDCLWGWPFPDLLILLPLFRPRPGWQKDLLFAICSLSLLCAYCFLSYHDIVYSGPRFVFEMTGFFALLSARSVLSLLDLFRKYRIAEFVFRIAVAILIVYPLAVRLPQQIRYHSQIYHGQTHEFEKLIDRANVGKDALILVGGDPFVFRSFFFQNSLIPSEGNRVYVRDLAEERSKLMSAYPRKEVWLVTIGLKPLPGLNEYPDHFLLREFGTQRLK